MSYIFVGLVVVDVRNGGLSGFFTPLFTPSLRDFVRSLSSHVRVAMNQGMHWCEDNRKGCQG